jgi:hypothetical protein
MVTTAQPLAAQLLEWHEHDVQRAAVLESRQPTSAAGDAAKEPVGV